MDEGGKDPGGEPRRLAGVPVGVRRLVQALQEAGHEALLVGGCVRDLVAGGVPADFDVTTSASAEQILALFPQAIPLGPRHGTYMVPTPAGPVDVTSFRGGGGLEADLAHRDFTLNALAWDPIAERLFDPERGEADLAAGRLRAVGDARARLAEDPLRALRAARLAAARSLRVDPEVERAMTEGAKSILDVARERVRVELSALLLAPGAGEGLALLRRTGLERELVPGAAVDAPALVAALPPDLELRLVAWLRGATRPVARLRELRFPRRSVQRVERLLHGHPIEGGVTDADPSVRRLLRRVGPEFAPLVALRRAELRHGAPAEGPDAAAGLARLDALEQAAARVRRHGLLALQRDQLALDGAAVMEILGIGPGPDVGRALRHLTDQVLEDPARNTPETLRVLLEAWAARPGGSQSP